jgi:hypothetical protein
MDALPKPDAHYEYYWINFKNSVTNASEDSPGHEGLHHLATQVPKLTAYFNDLQSRCEYLSIATGIQTFLKCYLVEVVQANAYHFSIARCNFRRWVHCQGAFIPLDDPDMKYLYFLYHCMITDEMQTFVGKVITGSGTDDRSGTDTALIEYAIQHERVGLLENLLEYRHEFTKQYVLSRYGIQLPNGLRRGAKLLKIISSR